MNACEAEILSITKFQPRKKYKNRQEYLASLLKQIDALPMDKFEYLLSEQVYAWYVKAAKAFKGFKTIPELPEVPVEELRTSSAAMEAGNPLLEGFLTVQRENVKELIEAHEKADTALEELQTVAEKIRPRRESKYRKEDPRSYLYPEVDRYGLLMNSKRHQAIEMLERGATMKEIREVTGHSMYNLLKKLRADGHRIVNAGGIIKLTHKVETEKET